MEIFLFLLAAAGLYWLLRPVQQRLERALRKFFKTPQKEKAPVIDITDYSKKDPK